MKSGASLTPSNRMSRGTMIISVSPSNARTSEGCGERPTSMSTSSSSDRSVFSRSRCGSSILPGGTPCGISPVMIRSSWKRSSNSEAMRRSRATSVSPRNASQMSGSYRRSALYQSSYGSKWRASRRSCLAVSSRRSASHPIRANMRPTAKCSLYARSLLAKAPLRLLPTS